MKVYFEAEAGDNGTPIEVANAIIKKAMADATYCETLEERRRELAEIAEHIQVFLKHSEVRK